MKRDLKQLAKTKFDLIVVGSGIYGAATAWDAATRGLSVALIEQSDFGAGTSANSLKTVHGGLRYLQQLDLIRFRESVRERRIMMHLAPHLVHPIPCVMPTYGYMMKGPAILFAGLLVNDILSADRNKLPDPEKKIPNGRIISRDECLRLIPGVEPTGINGGAFWTDAQMYSSERLLLAFVKSAEKNGAVVSNYVRATGLIREDDRVTGVRAEDCLEAGRFEIKADYVVNTTGAWVDDLNKASGTEEKQIKLSTAMNIVVNRAMLPGNAAGIYAPFTNVLADGSEYNGRHVLFMAPWRNHTIIGTYHRPYSGHPSEMKVKESEIENFLKEINGGYTGDPIKREEVSHVYKGFLPMDGVNTKTGEVILTKHYALNEYEEKNNLKGFMSVMGVKYTTARDVAKKTVDIVFKKTAKPFKRSKSIRGRLAGGDIERFDEFVKNALIRKPANISDITIQHLTRIYGSEYEQVLALANENKGWLKPVTDSNEVLKVEIIYAVRHEMALTLADVILRRSDLGSAGHPGEEVLDACVKLMAKELKWNKARTVKELEEVNSIYEIIKA